MKPNSNQCLTNCLLGTTLLLAVAFFLCVSWTDVLDPEIMLEIVGIFGIAFVIIWIATLAARLSDPTDEVVPL